MTQFPANTQVWKRKEEKIKVKTSRGSSHSPPVEKWWTLPYCFVQFPSQTMPLFALLYGTRDGNSPSAIYINRPNQHSVLILTRKTMSLRLIGHSTTPYLLTETTTYCMLRVTGHKVAKTLRGLIPNLAILLWTPQAPPESQSSEPSYTFPFQQKAAKKLMWPDISHLWFCLKQRKAGPFLFCSVLSPNRIITHFWVNFNKSSAELQLWHKEKQGQGGCRIMMCHPTSSWKWFCTGHKEIEMGDFVNPSTEQQTVRFG